MSNPSHIKNIARKVKTGLRRLKRRNGNPGWCPICEAAVFFEIRGTWLRDQYCCLRCGSIPRWRALMHMLNELYPAWRELVIHESSPGGPLSDKLKRECPQYVASHYLPGSMPGTMVKGFRCEDLARQTFPDQCFDLVVTSDVLEHLLEAPLAMAEIARTIRPGGAHVFTVPWYSKKKTLIRARLEDGAVKHIEPSDYHWNPVDKDGSLVVTEWGCELPFLLAEWTGLPTSVFRIVDRHQGLDGEFLEVFVRRKLK